MNSQGLTDADKIKLYKERLKELELTNESDKKQIQTLKEDIKTMKSKIKNLETFGGQVQDMKDFINLLNQVLIHCSPKKKEQKDALNKIVGILNNYKSKHPLPNTNPGTDGNQKKKCGGSIVISSVLISLLSLSGIGLLLYRKNKMED